MDTPHIIIKIDKRRLKFAQLIALQQGYLAALRDVIAQNMTCPSGEPLEIYEATAMLDELDGAQLAEVITKFKAAWVAAYPLVRPGLASRRWETISVPDLLKELL